MLDALEELKGVDDQPFDVNDYTELTAEERAERWPDPKYYHFLRLRLHDLKERPVVEVPGVDDAFGQQLILKDRATVCGRIAISSPVRTASLRFKSHIS